MNNAILSSSPRSMNSRRGGRSIKRCRSSRFFRAMETLESRQLLTSSLAIGVGGHSATFTDVDGDLVTVSVSVGSLVLGNFTMATPTNLHDQLETLDLTTGGFNGANVAISVKKVAGGDGLTNVGFINAAGVDLGSVTIAGDLGRINAGDSHTATAAITALSVRSMGRLGTDSQANGGSLESDILGNLGSLTVKGDIADAFINVQTAGDAVPANIGPITIGGSLVGDNTGRIHADGNIGLTKVTGDVIGGAGFFSGSIVANGSISGATIGGSVIGGPGFESGSFFCYNGSMGALTIGGDAKGGGGTYSCYLGSYHSNVGNVTIGGSLIGGTGGNSGLLTGISMGTVKIGGSVLANGNVGNREINAGANLASITIGGSLGAHLQVGGNLGVTKISGDVSGSISAGGTASDISIGGSLSGSVTSTTSIGKVSVTHNVSGTLTANSTVSGAIAAVTIGGSLSGTISAGTNISSLSVGGSVSGTVNAALTLGTTKITGDVDATTHMGATDVTSLTVGGSFNGGVYAVQTIGTTKITGDVTGGITAKHLPSIAIGGSLIGGSADFSGRIYGTLGVGTVKIGGSVIGGTGFESGAIGTHVGITAVTIGGSFSSRIFAPGTVSALTIGGDDTGTVNAGALTQVSIGGSLIGGSTNSTGVITTSTGDIGSITIKRNFIGGNSTQSSLLSQSGFIESGGRIGSVSIGGSIFAGQATGGTFQCGAIAATNDIGSLTVKGSLEGNHAGTNSANTVVISARGQAVQSATTDLAIGSITVGGRVELTNILAGYPPNLTATNGDAQIGTVTVGGDWIASNLVAGANNVTSGNVNFGDGNDTSIGAGNLNIFATIASVTIGGQIFGTPAAISLTDQFGFVAQQINAFKVGGASVILSPLAHTDDIPLGPNNDVSIHEV